MTVNQCIRQIVNTLHDRVGNFPVYVVGTAPQLYKFRNFNICFLGEGFRVKHICILDNIDNVILSIGHTDPIIEDYTYTALSGKSKVSYKVLKVLPIQHLSETWQLHNLFKKYEKVFNTSEVL